MVWKVNRMLQGNTAKLNDFEKKIVKRLLNDGGSNQDIQALVNKERPATINFGRIAEVKKDEAIVPATGLELNEYQEFKAAFDVRTGLNPFLDERLIKSREAIRQAISVFNSPSNIFRAEQFSVLAVIGWTYLILEYSHQNSLPTVRGNGKAISLADFIKSSNCPLSEGMKNNLRALIKIRDAVEHSLTGPERGAWTEIFQATCVNYEKTLVEHFGERLSMSAEASFALQMSGLSINQAIEMANSGLTPKIQSINAELMEKIPEEQRDDKEFRFSVVYTTVETSKSNAAFRFVSPLSQEGMEISNVLVKHKPSHLTHPFKPSEVKAEVKKRTKMKFNMSDHSLYWKEWKVRPIGGSPKPDATNLDYCYYNPTYKSYSYSQAWVERIVDDMTK